MDIGEGGGWRGEEARDRKEFRLSKQGPNQVGAGNWWEWEFPCNRYCTAEAEAGASNSNPGLIFTSSLRTGCGAVM